MKRLLIAAMLTLAAPVSSASAQLIIDGPGTYSTLGNQTYGPNGTQTQLGNRVYTPNNTYTTLGNRTYGSDGSSSQTLGNRTYGSDGTTSQTLGNRTYITGPDGKSMTCTKLGERTYCN